MAAASVLDFHGFRSALHRAWSPIFGKFEDRARELPSSDRKRPDNPTEAIANMRASSELLKEVARAQQQIAVGPDGVPDMLDEGLSLLAEKLRAL